ncbi:50S ribosomal protein L21 [Candidatus Gottesmanbacteria bacterium]|nr:50S ribosomal protein L21 [Candidatus Gottesmanbacteria bacterium]
MKYAIVKTGGKQYKVCEGETILIDRLNLKAGAAYIFPEVLLIRTDKNLFIGDPYVNGGKVTAKILGETKGKKIHIVKFKAKVRYRRRIGFRPIYSKVLIESIKEPASNKK